MRYIIDKGDLYSGKAGDIILTIGEIIKIETLPLGCSPPIIGRLLAVGDKCLKMDISKQYYAKIETFAFDRIWSLEVME